MLFSFGAPTKRGKKNSLVHGWMDDSVAIGRQEDCAAAGTIPCRLRCHSPFDLIGHPCLWETERGTQPALDKSGAAALLDFANPSARELGHCGGLGYEVEVATTVVV